MKIKKKKEKVDNRGAPSKPDDQKVNDYHYRNEQWKRIQQEATARNMGPFALLRQIVDWYFTALDTGRSDTTAFKIFDDTYREEAG